MTERYSETLTNTDDAEAEALAAMIAQHTATYGDRRGTPPPDNIVQWCERNITINGQSFSLRNRPFLKAIYEDRHDKICVMKSTQIGVTECAIRKAQHFVAHIQGNVIYTMPSKADVEDFSGGRWDPSMEQSPNLMAMRGAKDNISLKRFGKGFIYFRGTWTERQAISVPSDMNIHDELDFSKAGTLELYKARLDASPYKIQMLFSTPTLPGWGVHRHFQKFSDQRHWHIDCYHCGYSFALCCAYPDAIEQVSNCPDDLSKARMEKFGFVHYFACPKCKGEITPEDRCDGRWVAANPGAEWHGYHPTSMLAPWWTADQIIGARDNYALLKDFMNMTLGLPYALSKQQISVEDLDDMIDRRLKERRRATSDDVVTMGVDQGNELHVVLTAESRDGTSRKVIKAEVLGMDTGWATLARYMRQYKVRFAVVDALPNHKTARDFVKDFKGRAYCCYYSRDKRKTGEADWSEDDENGIYEVKAHRTDSLDETIRSLLEDELQFPNVSIVHDQVFPHLCNIRRLEAENRVGKLEATYEKVGPDHFAHAVNYARLALTRIKRHRGVKNLMADESDDVECHTEQADLVNGKKRPRVRQKDRIRQGWR